MSVWTALADTARTGAVDHPHRRHETLPFSVFALALVVTAVLAAPPALGQASEAQDSPLTVSLELHRIDRDAAGEERLVPAETVKPGDLLVYTAVYANGADTAVNGVTATLPVPDGMEYQPRSASPEGVLAATNDGEYAPEPLMRRQRAADGSEYMEPVPYVEYRFLRWQLGSIGPGDSIEVKARVRVSAEGTPDEGGRSEP